MRYRWSGFPTSLEGERLVGDTCSSCRVTPSVQTLGVTTHDPTDDPVPRSVVLDLDEVFRVLEALEDARLALRELGAAPGLQDELATVIRVLHGKLGLDEGGVL